MATYDSGINWDSGSRWDEADKPKTPKKMAKIKLNIHSKSDNELHAFGTGHIEAMDGNANFPTPSPDDATFGAATVAFLALIDGQAAAQAAAASATADKDAGRIVYENIIRDRATYVESTSVGDEAQILSSGFEVRSTPTAVGDLPAPVDFLATMGDMPGEIDLTWSPVYGASVYMVECREHIDPIQWKPTTVFTASKATVKNLISAQTYAFRVSAIGAAGQGPWSDESVKMVP